MSVFGNDEDTRVCEESVSVGSAVEAVTGFDQEVTLHTREVVLL